MRGVKCATNADHKRLDSNFAIELKSGTNIDGNGVHSNSDFPKLTKSTDFTGADLRNLCSTQRETNNSLLSPISKPTCEDADEDLSENTSEIPNNTALDYSSNEYEYSNEHSSLGDAFAESSFSNQAVLKSPISVENEFDDETTISSLHESSDICNEALLLGDLRNTDEHDDIFKSPISVENESYDATVTMSSTPLRKSPGVLSDCQNDGNFSGRKIGKEGRHFHAKLFKKFHMNPSRITLNYSSDKTSFDLMFASVLPHTSSMSPKRAVLHERTCMWKSPEERGRKAALCLIFTPVDVGSVAAEFFGETFIGDKYPQFSLIDKNELTERKKSNPIRCEICETFRKYEEQKGRLRYQYGNMFEGFIQIYDHYTSVTHQDAIKWWESSPNICPKNVIPLVKKASQKSLASYFQVDKTVHKPCPGLQEEAIVDSFKKDREIRRVTAKTMFQKRKCWTFCEHSNCINYKFWCGKHPEEYMKLKQACEGRCNSIFIHPSSSNDRGGIKSIDPPCLGTIRSDQASCVNCLKQRSILVNLMEKRKKSSHGESSNRSGLSGVRRSYLKVDEISQRNEDLESECSELRKQIAQLERNEDSWATMLHDSCANGEQEKLIIDLMSLFSQPINLGLQSPPFIILNNLVKKLKSKSNHQYCDFIKDVAGIHKNRLGSSNYSLLKNIFGRPCSTTASAHVNTNKIELGLNEKVFRNNPYGELPVTDCSDEARALRYLEPCLLPNGDIELIGGVWDPNVDRWCNCKQILKRSNADDYSKLVKIINSLTDTNGLAKSFGIHNFSLLTGGKSMPQIYALWPTPNKGYTSYHVLHMWDKIRYLCFVNDNKQLRKHPILLMGHCTDSAGFQLAAAVSLMTPSDEFIRSGVLYLGLGIGESKYAAPYLGPLPSIAYLDYDHCLRLFLKNLKYESLDLSVWPGLNAIYISIDHLKELQIKCQKSKLDLSFSANDLLLPSFMEQNVDGALKIMTLDVVKLLKDHVKGSEGTQFYIEAVSHLFNCYLNPSGDPEEMQKSLSCGITLLRLWREVVERKTSMRLHAKPGAKTDINIRGNFITYGTFKTAECLFTAATCHFLAMFAHFKELGPTESSPFQAGTRSTERLIGELQGKTTQFQSLNAQPTIGEALQRAGNIQFNQCAEERISSHGVHKQPTTNRKRLAFKIKQVKESNYNYPATYDIFLENQRAAHKAGVKMGKEIFKVYFPEVYTFLSPGKKKLSRFLVPKDNLFLGNLPGDYGLEKLKHAKAAMLAANKCAAKEEKIKKYIIEDEVLDVDVPLDEDDDKCNNDLFIDEDNSSDVPNQGMYISKGNEKIHIKTAIKTILGREYVARERSRRHIASIYLPRTAPIKPDHDVIKFRYYFLQVKKKFELVKLVSLQQSSKSILTCKKSDKETKGRFILLESVHLIDFAYVVSNPLKFTCWLNVSNILVEANLTDNGEYLVLEKQSQEAYTALSERLNNKVPDCITVPLIDDSDCYYEVESILNRRVCAKTHSFEYLVHYAGYPSSDAQWVPESFFNGPITYVNPRGNRKRSSEAIGSSLYGTTPAKKAPSKDYLTHSLKDRSVNISLKSHEKSNVKKSNNLKPGKPLPTVPRQQKSVLKVNKFKQLCAAVDEVEQNLEPMLMLTSDDLNALTRGEELSDNIMYAVRILLKRKFPGVQGLHDTVNLLARSRKSDCELKTTGFAVQIHHMQDCKIPHWVTSCCINNEVYVLDSSGLNPDSSLQTELCAIYSTSFKKTTYLKILYPSCQKQDGVIDCGLFAVAHAYSLCFHKRLVEKELFRVTSMRPHLKSCFKNSEILDFPPESDKNPIKMTSAKEFHIHICNTCSLPTMVDGEFKICRFCSSRCHPDCGNINTNDNIWSCMKCSQH